MDDYEVGEPGGSQEGLRWTSRCLADPRGRARQRDRARFAQVLDDAAEFLERHGELPDAVRWLRKEARAWRSAMR